MFLSPYFLSTYVRTYISEMTAHFFRNALRFSSVSQQEIDVCTAGKLRVSECIESENTERLKEEKGKQNMYVFHLSQSVIFSTLSR